MEQPLGFCSMLINRGGVVGNSLLISLNSDYCNIYWLEYLICNLLRTSDALLSLF